MKKILLYSFLLTILFGASSCDKDSEDISTMTTYATIVFDKVVILKKGESFTPAATATEGETAVDVAISGSVNVDAVGVYTINYSAVNSDGYSAVSSQSVIVYDPTIVATDVSGEIMDKSKNDRTATISLVEGTSNIFYCTDFAYSGVFPMYFQMDGDTMTVIPQDFVFGATGVNAVYDPAAREFSITVIPDGYSYSFQYK